MLVWEYEPSEIFVQIESENIHIKGKLSSRFPIFNNASNLQQFSKTSFFRTTFITLWFDNIELQSWESTILIGGDAFEHIDGYIIDSEEIAITNTENVFVR